MRRLILFSLLAACNNNELGYTQALEPGYLRLQTSSSNFYQCSDWTFEEFSVYMYCARTNEGGEEQLIEVDLLQEGGEFDGILNAEQTDIGGSIHISGGDAAGCVGGCGSEMTDEQARTSCDVSIDGESLGIISCGNTMLGQDNEDAQDDEGAPVSADGGFIIDWGVAVQLHPAVHDQMVESFE